MHNRNPWCERTTTNPSSHAFHDGALSWMDLSPPKPTRTPAWCHRDEQTDLVTYSVTPVTLSCIWLVLPPQTGSIIMFFMVDVLWSLQWFIIECLQRSLCMGDGCDTPCSMPSCNIIEWSHCSCVVKYDELCQECCPVLVKSAGNSAADAGGEPSILYPRVRAARPIQQSLLLRNLLYILRAEYMLLGRRCEKLPWPAAHKVRGQECIALPIYFC